MSSSCRMEGYPEFSFRGWRTRRNGKESGMEIREKKKSLLRLEILRLSKSLLETQDRTIWK